MKCPKCHNEVTEDQQYCPSCGAKIKAQSRFSKKLEAENKQRDHKKKMELKEEERQKKIIAEKGLKNKYSLYPIIFGGLGTAVVLWPAGYAIQIQWWYVTIIFILGAIGYYFAIKANKLNEKYFQHHRVRVDAKRIKIGVYLCAFTLLAGAILLFVFVPYYFPM